MQIGDLVTADGPHGISLDRFPIGIITYVLPLDECAFKGQGLLNIQWLNMPEWGYQDGVGPQWVKVISKKDDFLLDSTP
jgi:hypothetical protein